MKQIILVMLFSVSATLAEMHSCNEDAQLILFALGAAGCFSAAMAALADLLEK